MAFPLLAAFSTSFAPLSGVSIPKVATGEPVNLGDALSSKGTTVLVLGTYPADFNMIEYGQKVRHYLPGLKEKGVDRVLCVINGKPSSCTLLADLIGLPDEVELLSDEAGEAGRAFGVGRGWLPDQDKVEVFGTDVPVSPYAKLFGMLLGLGAGVGRAAHYVRLHSMLASSRAPPLATQPLSTRHIQHIGTSRHPTGAHATPYQRMANWPGAP